MNENTLKRIGIMGGSFDPVHTGHVMLARDALDQAQLDRILVIPARTQPFKQNRPPVCGEDRMAMLELAFADDPKITPDDYELTQEGVSYTYLTLRAMQERFGEDARLYFITGTDSMLKLHTWMKATELLANYSFIVGDRPGYRETELSHRISMLQAAYGTEIIRIDNEQFDISATQIREKLAAGESVSGLVPRQTEEYIIEHGLYRQPQQTT